MMGSILTLDAVSNFILMNLLQNEFSIPSLESAGGIQFSSTLLGAVQLNSLQNCTGNIEFNSNSNLVNILFDRLMNVAGASRSLHADCQEHQCHLTAAENAASVVEVLARLGIRAAVVPPLSRYWLCAWPRHWWLYSSFKFADVAFVWAASYKVSIVAFA